MERVIQNVCSEHARVAYLVWLWPPSACYFNSAAFFETQGSVAIDKRRAGGFPGRLKLEGDISIRWGLIWSFLRYLFVCFALVPFINISFRFYFLLFFMCLVIKAFWWSLSFVSHCVLELYLLSLFHANTSQWNVVVYVQRLHGNWLWSMAVPVDDVHNTIAGSDMCWSILHGNSPIVRALLFSFLPAVNCCCVCGKLLIDLFPLYLAYYYQGSHGVLKQGWGCEAHPIWQHVSYHICF